MPRRTDIHKILLIGSGPIVIGQACEFDYSGTQALKALKEEGYEVVLVNSNPATIMTDPEMADHIYIEPLTLDSLKKIIEKERPDALLPTLGGQTALNLAVRLHEEGVLDRHRVSLIGASIEAIRRAEDRRLFKEIILGLGLGVPASKLAYSLDEALGIMDEIGLPAIIRPAFTLGGSGGNVAYTKDEYHRHAEWGLRQSPIGQILVERSVLGWKEYELEVMRDRKDNVTIICSIENLDPMGIHTGDSITVAPAQTLTDKEYQGMRDAAIKIMRAVGVDTGGSNIQFAVNPADGEMLVIEMNPRVSRSSALASKATGFPIAKIATKLAVGYTLDELPNDITKKTCAAFEPTIDYVVTKIPRFNFEKFPRTEPVLTTQMKSVGEVMAIGRTFKESLEKALRSLETGLKGLDPPVGTPDEIIEHLKLPTPDRILWVGAALKAGIEIEEVNRLTGIDKWFLYQIEEMVNPPSPPFPKGGQDRNIPPFFKGGKGGIRVYKTVDTCAAEFTAFTPYYYSTFEEEDEGSVRDGSLILSEAPPHGGAESKDPPSPLLARPVQPPQAAFGARRRGSGGMGEGGPARLALRDRRARVAGGGGPVVILGSGPNRIGQGIEFDYCCVQASLALKEMGITSIMVNCNPETVSTDYDTSDRLYFEPITFDDVMPIIERERPLGIIIQFGGQTPLKLAQPLANAGVKILGTPVGEINRAEDRKLFKELIERLTLKQPTSGTAMNIDEASKVAEQIGYPVLVRPSYVLGGRAMEIVYDKVGLEFYMRYASQVSPEHPVLIDRFLSGATEVDVDAVSDGDEVWVAGIMEHIEEAGIHSGDSSCVLPPHSLTPEVVSEIERQTVMLARALKVVGLMNVQYAVQNGTIYVLEVNPRASRTVPFVSKAIGVPLARIATKVMLGLKLPPLNPPFLKGGRGDYYAVKTPVFPFDKFPGVDTLLGPEMKSTGEVMGIAPTFGAAFAKAQIAAGNALPASGTVFISVKDDDKNKVADIAAKFLGLGFKIMATHGTKAFLASHGIPGVGINKMREGPPHIIDEMIGGKVVLVINTTASKLTVAESYPIRRTALERRIPYFTTVEGARAAAEAIRAMKEAALEPIDICNR